jgi:predicted RNA binding protein YcfA (HicA-like mRNA interferase family)
LPKLPVVSGREMLRAFVRAGFSVDRITGSHHYVSKGDINLSVPVHGSKPLTKGLTANLIKQAGLTVEEFIELLK